MYKTIPAIALTCLLDLVPSSALAEPLWHSENIAYLVGDDYRVLPSRQQTVTLEHVSGWTWGDVFAFVDVTDYPGEAVATSVYGEWSPRLSLSWLTGREFTLGIIDDVLLAATVEMGSGDVEHVLLGPGLALSVPGFSFFNLNAQYRFARYGEDQGWQLTAAWSWRRDLWGSALVIDGYADWVVASRDGNQANLHFSPQIKLDVGPWLGARSDVFYAGFEYDYWSNKFGIADTDAFSTDQSALSVMVQLKF